MYDHKTDLITLIKCTRSTGHDYRTGTVLYEVGATIEDPTAELLSDECCRPGLHLSPTAREACAYINRSTRGPRARFFECLVAVSDLLAVAEDKIRVRRLYVHREIPIEEALPGVDFAGIAGRIEAMRAEMSTWKTIPWLRPSRQVTDEELHALFAQWHAAITPWLPSGRVLPLTLRVVRDRPAAAAAADADAAADAAAAAAADAADAAAAGFQIWPYWARWYIRPYYVLWRAARWAIYGIQGTNPWAPLVEIMRLGCAPIGYVKGEGGDGFVIYAPEPRP